jgi:hypothetical protein
MRVELKQLLRSHWAAILRPCRRCSFYSIWLALRAGRLTKLGKWFERLGLFLLVIFGLLYVGAKIHFFTRYGVLGT